MTKGPKPPAHLAPYVSILGIDLTIDYLLAFGGSEKYVAVREANRSAVIALVGAEKAKRLADANLPRRVPLAKKWIAQVFHFRGFHVAEIARTLHVSDVTVRRYLDEGGAKRPPPDTRQPDLFS